MEIMLMVLIMLLLFGAWWILSRAPKVDHHISDGFVLTH